MGGWIKGWNALLTGVLLASYPALTAAALWPLPWVFAAVVPLSYAAELALPKPAADRLSRIHLGTTLRFMTREAAAVLLLARIPGVQARWFVLLAGGLFLFQGARAAQTGLAAALHRCHGLMPITTRNLEPPSLRVPPPPPEILIRWRGLRLLYLDALPVGLTAYGTLAVPYAGPFGGPLWGRLGGPLWGYGSVAGLAGVAGVAVALGIQAVTIAVLLVYLRRAWQLRDRQRVIAAVDEAVRAYRPQVLLYLSGPRDAIHRATTWLGTLERISLRALVVLRERGLLPVLGPTALPVLCVPSTVDLTRVRGLGSARVALFVTNTDDNIHLLRTPWVRGVFIGDGDHETPFDRFMKLYDEVWVAGPAGRERFRRAGVRDEDIAEVCRPQLAGISGTSPYAEGTVPYRTVLYTPTWEGRTDDLCRTSIIAMGPALVRALLRQPDLRLIYTPHPLTGRRSGAARAAHREIVALLRAAEGRAVPPLIGRAPALYEYFNQADLLISDVSDVVVDFLANGKPYVVTNVAGLPEADFRGRYPSGEAAYLLGGDLRELEEILDRVRNGGDVMAGKRRRLRARLLGPDDLDPLTRFDEAVKRAWVRASDAAPVRASHAHLIRR